MPAQNRPTWRRAWVLALVVFTLLATLSLITAYWQWRHQQINQTLADNLETAAITAEIRERLAMHGQFLRSLQAFASTHPRGAADVWSRFEQSIESEVNQTGRFAFAYAPLAKREGNEKFQFPENFRLPRNLRPIEIFPTPSGDTALPIVFIASRSPEADRATGFDLYSDPARQRTIQRAIQYREVSMTGPLVLIADQTTQRPGFQMMQALYDNDADLSSMSKRQTAFRGLVIAAFRADEFMASIKQVLASRFILRIHDEPAGDEINAPATRTLLYESAPKENASEEKQVLHHEIDFGGRTWQLEFSPKPSRDGQVEPAYLIASGGLLCSLLLAMLTYHLSTHRERAERYAQSLNTELARHRDHLQELVDARTTSLNEALCQAQAASHAKSEFLTNMTHELRTPMHAILGFVEMGKHRAEENSKLAQYFCRIGESGERLLRLIDELLDLAKLDAAPDASHLHPAQEVIHPQPIDLLQIIRQVAAQTEPLLAAKAINLNISSHCDDTLISADPARLTQVFWNLFSNAIRFSPEGGTLDVSVANSTLAAGRRASDAGKIEALEVKIADQGVGIPEAELDLIFDKFVQSTRTRKGSGGTGLGLAICRAIISRHRGTIVAENNLGGGAAFIVTLPRNTADGEVR